MSEYNVPADLARRIRLVVLDVDGVLTDGGLYMGAGPDGGAIELKRFEITDGLGIKMLQRAGLHVVLVSGRNSPANRVRGDELEVPWYEGHGGFKREIVERVQDEQDASWAETACMSDDLADLPVFRRAGLAVAVANAVPEVMAEASFVTTRRGGQGAVREFAEALLKARGQWRELVEQYVARRDRPAQTEAVL